jgi:hypothetical protein
LPDEFQIDSDEYDEPHPIVYLQTEGVFAIIVSYGTYVSKVRFNKGGILYEVYVENDEFLEHERHSDGD